MKNKKILYKKNVKNPYYSIITVVKNDEKYFQNNSEV